MDSDKKISLPEIRMGSDKNNQNPLNFWIASVSGARFMLQLGTILNITDAHRHKNNGSSGTHSYLPHIFLTASGGSIAATLLLAADAERHRVEQLIKTMTPDLLRDSWWPKPFSSILPSWLLFFLKGSIYRMGDGAKKFMRRIFTTHTFQRIELWISLTEDSQSKGQLICNRSEDTAIIRQVDEFHQKMSNFNPHIYLNGDVEQLAPVLESAVSIPLLFSGSKVGEKKYVDGGVSGAGSSILAVESQIKEIVLKEKRNLRLIYFCPYDLDNNEIKSKNGLASPVVTNIWRFLHVMMIMDRKACIDLLEKVASQQRCQIEKRRYEYITIPRLAELLKEIDQYEHSLVFVFPAINSLLNLTEFHHRDLINEMQLGSESMIVEVYLVLDHSV